MGIEQKGWVRGISPSYSLVRTLVFSCLHKKWKTSSSRILHLQALRLELYPPTLQSLQLAISRSGDYSVFIITQANFYNKSCCKYLLRWSCFSREPWLTQCNIPQVGVSLCSLISEHLISQMYPIHSSLSELTGIEYAVLDRGVVLP